LREIKKRGSKRGEASLSHRALKRDEVPQITGRGAKEGRSPSSEKIIPLPLFKGKGD